MEAESGLSRFAKHLQFGRITVCHSPLAVAVLDLRQRTDGSAGGPGQLSVLVSGHTLLLSPFLWLGSRMVLPGVPRKRPVLVSHHNLLFSPFL